MAFVIEGFGGVFHRLGQRRFAFGRDTANRGNDIGAGSAHVRQGLDIRAIALGAMAVGHQAQALCRGQAAHQFLQHVTGNDNLVDAIDLSPHGTRGVEDKNCVRRRRRGRRQGLLLCNSDEQPGRCKQHAQAPGDGGSHWITPSVSPFCGFRAPVLLLLLTGIAIGVGTP